MSDEAIEAKLRKDLGRDVDKIITEEAAGDANAFADWMHSLYMAIGGDKLSDFEEFKASPLAADMIADWQYECSDHADRVELLTHILGMYQVADYDEPEQFDEEGNPILPA